MRIGSLDFSPSRWPTLVTLVVFGFLLSLGFWQLDRAEQKREIIKNYQVDKDGAVIRLDADLKSAAGLEYQRATSVGRYDSAHQLLLDNRIYEGQAGYQVLTPFILRNSEVAVLVNRGWLPLGESRDQLPDLAVGEAQRTVLGRLKTPPEKVFMLGEEELRQQWPYRIQRIQFQALSDELQRTLLPVVLLLENEEPDGYLRDWQPLAGFGPERNVGYAVQWFGLAAALLIIYFTVNSRKAD
ncbi:MAG: SURF1 family protein [Pseudomonadota bacterium]|nr:SURF1 family protein [Pseudomonadota bacterium]